jgi:hypothetical protein
VSGKQRSHSACDLILDGKNILQVAIIVLGPKMARALGIDQLRGDPDAVSSLANAPLQNVTDPEVASDVAHVSRLPLPLEARIAGDDEESAKARQLSGDVLGEAIDKIFLLRISAQIGEGEDRDSRPIRERQRRWGSFGRRSGALTLTFANLADEADALPGECADQSLIATGVADDLSGGR